jgi:histidinol-phosphate aminotransferase
MVVTRSFSKCFGLAGLRVGYMIASGPIIVALRRAHNPKSINRMAQVGAAAALDDLPYYHRYVAALKQSAAMTRAFCDENRIPCRLSHANFVLLSVDEPVRVAARLREVGVHVRDRSSQLPGMIRITLGTPEQMRDVLQRLGRVLSARSGPRPSPRA